MVRCAPLVGGLARQPTEGGISIFESEGLHQQAKIFCRFRFRINPGNQICPKTQLNADDESFHNPPGLLNVVTNFNWIQQTCSDCT